MRANLLVLTLLAGPALSQEVLQHPPSFEPRPLPAHIYAGGWEHFVGGGVAAFDCDGDQMPELYIAGGDNPAQLMRNETPHPGADLAFRAQTPPALQLRNLIGAYPLDIDGDAILDLAILRVGPDILLRGLGDCEFALFDNLGFDSADHWTTAFSATWEGDNQLPTLAFGTYVDRADPAGPFETCDDTLLYRPENGRYGAPQHLTPGYCALSMLFTDWNRDGHADLRISNDRHYYGRVGQEQMWAMWPEPRQYTPDDGWRPYHLWGMGIASRDITQDGYADVFLTSMGDQKLQTLAPDADGPTYLDATFDYGTTAHRPHTGQDGRPSTGWHAAFGDVNNDGRDDIFIAKGNVEQMPDAAMQDPNNLLMQLPHGRFQEASVEAGIASMQKSRGAALLDLNLDGRLDLTVVNRRSQAELYQNTTTGGTMLGVIVTAPPPNTQAIGTVIEVLDDSRLQTREITVGGGHASGTAGILHFGLGDQHSADIRAIWPDGTVGDWQSVAANQVVPLSRDH